MIGSLRINCVSAAPHTTRKIRNHTDNKISTKMKTVDLTTDGIPISALEVGSKDRKAKYCRVINWPSNTRTGIGAGTFEL